jgi:hypothetical protein
MVCRQIFRMRLLCCHDHLLSLVVHLACHLVLHLERHLVHLHQRSHHRHLLDEVHQIRRDDLHLVVVHQSRLVDLRRLVPPVEDHRNHRDDLRLDDLVHLDERRLDEVLPLRRRQDVVLHCRMKMDYCLRAVGAVLK